MYRRGGIMVLSELFVSQDRNEKLCKGTLLFSGNFLVSKKKLWMRGGISRFSVEFFMSHDAENFRKGILLFLRKFLVAKVLWMKKGVSRFSLENFWCHRAEKFRGHPFNVSKKLGYRKILCIIGNITSFRRKFFVSQYRKISWASLQCFRKFGLSKIFLHSRGYHKVPSKNFCLTVLKNFAKEPFSVSIISGIKNARDKS